MVDKIKGDGAIRREGLYGSSIENAYAGVLSFLRRKYTRDLTGADIVVSGIPLDLATTFRPGTRFGPQAIRAASVQLVELRPILGDSTHLMRLQSLIMVIAGSMLIIHSRSNRPLLSTLNVF